jgi:glycosyltransferase involved in cell wall biosynthesis
MERPLVSIITPVLNRIDTIEASLASVSNQTYGHIEHILVDGGSTDGTLEFLSQYRPPHPFRWISEPDNGMYEAINKGMSLSRGEVLAYLNSDDLYLPWSVDVAVQAMQPGTELVYGDLGILAAKGNGAAGAFAIQFYPEFELRHYSFVSTLGQPTVFWRRSLTERIGPFDTRYRLIGDCEYWLRAAINGAKLKHVPEVLAVQVEHGSTLRATQAPRLREEFDTLRGAMMDVIDPPVSLGWERLKKSALWRARQLELFYAMKTRSPRKWRHFVTELRAHGIDVSFRDLRVLAPARWRGHASLFGDVTRVGEILGSRQWA